MEFTELEIVERLLNLLEPFTGELSQRDYEMYAEIAAAAADARQVEC